MNADAKSFRRQMGMDMIRDSGAGYDLTEQRSGPAVINGKFIIQPGETLHGFRNNFGVPVSVLFRNSRAQAYELLG